MASLAGDPVQRGFVASLRRPSTNITGVALTSESQMTAKRLEHREAPGSGEAHLNPAVGEMALERGPALAGAGARAEKMAAHIVVDANDIKPLRHQEARSLGAN